MEIITNDLKLDETQRKMFASVLGKMVAEFFKDPDNQKEYEKQKPKLTAELKSLEKKIKGGKEANEVKRNSNCER